MNERGFTGVFLSALIIGAVATFSVYKLVVEQRMISVGPETTTVPVVVAVGDIAEGMVLHANLLRMKQYDPDALPEGTFASIDSLAERVTQIPIFTGEPILEGKLAPIGTAAGLEIKIAPGKRAMAIPVNDHVGIAGFVQPNSRVDVLVTFRNKTGRNDQQAKVFLQNMRVLSVGQHLYRGDDGKPITANTVTLEVSPEDAELLAVAMNEGVLSLALRGFADEDSVRTTGATPQSVLAAAQKFQARPRPRVVTQPQTPAEPEPAPVVEEEPWKVVIFRGSEMSEREVESADSAQANDTTQARKSKGPS
ncbi:MAG: Flp pilus assembly protein CpaB [Gemmatimonadota bacterium]|nr:MAG: Flp pilus assembly protein CpaB [Gemmatimonadota bacterium]